MHTLPANMKSSEKVISSRRERHIATKIKVPAEIKVITWELMDEGGGQWHGFAKWTKFVPFSTGMEQKNTSLKRKMQFGQLK